MGLFTADEVVLLPFPFSDQRGKKIRPVLLVADVGRGDWIACQITSNPYADLNPVRITQDHFATGGLIHASYLRPGKISTLHESQILRILGVLAPAVLETCRNAIISRIRP